MNLTVDQARAMVMGQNLTNGQRLMLIALIEWGDGLHHAHVTQGTLAESLHMTVRSVGEHVRELQQRGYLYVAEEGKYMIPWPFVDEMQMVGGPKRERRFLMEREEALISYQNNKEKYERLGYEAEYARTHHKEREYVQALAEADKLLRVLEKHEWFLKFTQEEEGEAK